MDGDRVRSDRDRREGTAGVRPCLSYLILLPYLLTLSSYLLASVPFVSPCLRTLRASLQPYVDVWSAASDFSLSLPVWTDGPFMELDPTEVEQKSRAWAVAIRTQPSHFEK